MENSKSLNKFVITDSEKFRKKLRELGTPQSIGEKTNIDEYKIERWLRNDILPTTYDIEDILNTFNLNLEELGATITDEDEYLKKIFRQRLEELKKEKNVSQAKIAKDNSFPGSTVNYWFKNDEKGTIPKGLRLKKLAKYFGVSVSYLRGETDNRNTNNEIIGARLGMNDESIATREEIKNTTVYGKKFEEEVKNIYGFNHSDIANYLTSDIGFVDVFYGETLKVLSYYSGGKFKNSFDSLFNEMEVDLTENELLGNDNDKDYLPMEISTPYRVTIETMAKENLKKKIGIMFDEFIDEIVKKKQISKYNDYNNEEKKIKEKIRKLKDELANIEQVKKEK